MNSFLGRMGVMPVLQKSALFPDSATLGTSHVQSPLSTLGLRGNHSVPQEPAFGQQHRGLDRQLVGCGAANLPPPHSLGL